MAKRYKTGKSKKTASVTKAMEPEVAMLKSTPKDRAVSSFSINFGRGERKEIRVRKPYGFFINQVRNAMNYSDLNHLIGTEGLTLKDVKPLVEYLDLSNEKFATLAGISSRTISRWGDEDTIGVMASKTLMEVDRLSEKGSMLFGSKELFKDWLHQRNTALGDAAPIEILTEPYGVELVDDALEAMRFGNVM